MGFHQLRGMHPPLAAQSTDLPRIFGDGGTTFIHRASLDRRAGNSLLCGTTVGADITPC